MSAALALFVAIAAGQAIAQFVSYLSDLPVCAQQPLGQVLSVQGCTTSDKACICDEQNLAQGIAETIVTKCNEADGGVALGMASGICAPITGTTSVGPDGEAFATTVIAPTAGVTVSGPLSTLFSSTEIEDPSETGYFDSTEPPALIAASIIPVGVLTGTHASSTGVPITSATVVGSHTGGTIHSTTSSPTSTGGASWGITKLGWASLGMGTMGVVFAML